MSKDTNKSLKRKETTQTLLKKARKKHFGNFLSMLLAHVPDTKLRSSYINSYYCSAEIQQRGNKVSTNYCKTRWCNTCNNIYTAKMINTFSPLLKEFEEPRFVTLTLPTVQGGVLPYHIKYRTSTLTKIIRKVSDKLGPVNALRKLECTYNLKDDLYHPHIHMIMDGEKKADMIVKQWLEIHPQADPGAQQNDACYGKYELELFKYFTKLVTKTGKVNFLNAHSLNTIFESMRGSRVYASYGSLYGLKLDENFSDLDALVLEDLPDTISRWIYDQKQLDWYSPETGELFTGYKPSESLVQLLNNSFKGDVRKSLEDFYHYEAKKSSPRENLATIRE